MFRRLLFIFFGYRQRALPQAQRDALIAEIEVARDGYYQRQWNDIVRWIERMVVWEPRIMAKVAKAEFGNLMTWLNQAEVDGICGCLVGTTGLCLIRDRNNFKPGAVMSGGSFFRTVAREEVRIAGELVGPRGNIGAELDVSAAVAELVDQRSYSIRELQDMTHNAGVGAADIGHLLGPERAVPLIKDEILRALAAR